MPRVYLVSFLACASVLMLSSCAPADTAVVTLDAEARTYLNDRSVGRDALEIELRVAVEAGVRLVYIRPDERVVVSEIWDLVDDIQNTGVWAVGAYLD